MSTRVEHGKAFYPFEPTDHMGEQARAIMKVLHGAFRRAEDAHHLRRSQDVVLVDVGRTCVQSAWVDHGGLYIVLETRSPYSDRSIGKPVVAAARSVIDAFVKAFPGKGVEYFGLDSLDKGKAGSITVCVHTETISIGDLPVSRLSRTGKRAEHVEESHE